MYKAIKYFEDLQDNGRPYNEGDVFPYGDKVVSKERINELLTDQNRRRTPLIVEVAETPIKSEKPSKKATKKAVKKTEE